MSSGFPLDIIYYNLKGSFCQPFRLTFRIFFKKIFDKIHCLVYYVVVGVCVMTARQVIEMALAYKGMKNVELAAKLGWSPQLLNKRLNTGKFTVEEWETIGVAIGAEARVVFRFPDGREI